MEASGSNTDPNLSRNALLLSLSFSVLALSACGGGSSGGGIPPAQPPCPIIQNARIMPLGDSITLGEGEEPPGGAVAYRQKLYDDLVAAGYLIDFVGGESDGAFADADHEGHSGWTAAEVAAAVTDWLNANPPDIVLLHIGTNGLDPTNGDDDVADILDAIDSWEAANGNPITVFLARIIDQDPINPDVETFNDNVQAMALSRVNDTIILVNQHDALAYPDDLFDSLHPNLTGYGKMADAWFTPLTECLAKS
ncbi:MAG: GDSL-type esterase/lipase family protein [Acidiferrobacterales bacterium]